MFRMAALRLSFVARSFAVPRQTMHQQFFGPPRLSKSFSRSCQLDGPTSVKTTSEASCFPMAATSLPDPGLAGNGMLVF